MEDRTIEPKRFNYLIWKLNRFELTGREKHFIELTRLHFLEKGDLNEEQKVILECLYKEKMAWVKQGLIRETS